MLKLIIENQFEILQILQLNTDIVEIKVLINILSKNIN